MDRPSGVPSVLPAKLNLATCHLALLKLSRWEASLLPVFTNTSRGIPGCCNSLILVCSLRCQIRRCRTAWCRLMWPLIGLLRQLPRQTKHAPISQHRCTLRTPCTNICPVCHRCTEAFCCIPHP